MATLLDAPELLATDTTVTGVVIDSDNVHWIRCGWRAVLTGYVGATPRRISDGTLVVTSKNGVADNAGNIAVSLAPNNDITPSGTKWRFTFYPLATDNPSAFDVQITGAAQDISAQIRSGIVAPRWPLNGINYGYDDKEVFPYPSANTPAISYINTAILAVRVWNGVTFVDAIAGDLPSNAAVVDGANIFTVDQTIQANLTITEDVTAGGNIHSNAVDLINSATLVDAPKAQLRVATPNLLANPPAPNGGIFLAWDRGTGGTWFGNGFGASVAHVSNNGVGRFNGGLQIGPTGNLASIDGTGTLSLSGTASVNGGISSSSLFASGMSQLPAQGTLRIGYDTTTGYFDAFGPNPATKGSMHFRVLTGDTSSYFDAMQIDSDGTTEIAGNLKADQLMSRTNGWLLLNRDSGTAVYFGNGVGGTVGSVDSAGNAAFNGTLHSGPLTTAGPVDANGITIWGNQTAALNYPNLRSSSDGHLYISPSPAKNLYLMPDGGNAIVFCNGNGGLTVGDIDTTGNMNVNGNFFAGGGISCSGTKAFKIPHPIRAAKQLVHACIEGPESAVYYRGESETFDGIAEIVLPDYFEALTLSKERTILLTQIVEDDDSPSFIQLAAGRISKGIFRVFSSVEKCKFFWEVKAIRSDLKELAVEIPA